MDYSKLSPMLPNYDDYDACRRLNVDPATAMRFSIGDIYLDSHGNKHIVAELLTFDWDAPRDGPYEEWYRPALTYSIHEGRLVSYVLKPEGYVEATRAQDFAPLVSQCPASFWDQVEFIQQSGIAQSEAIRILNAMADPAELD